MREASRQRSRAAVAASEPPGRLASAESVVVPRGTSVDEAPLEGASQTFADGLIDALCELGVQHAYAVFGGGIAPVCESVSRSSIRLMHFRHEAGAAFAAIEDSLASGRLTVVIATTGPGVTNLYTGMTAARSEGAKVLFLSGATPAAQRGRGAFQETGVASSLSPLFAPGSLFHLACIPEDPAELEVLIAKLASGITRPNGFVAHLGLPMGIQTARLGQRPRPSLSGMHRLAVEPSAVERCVELLSRESFVIWAGFGARNASAAVQRLAERAGAMVMASPRAKGVMPEHHPLYLGVSGLGGHSAVDNYFRHTPPARVLVLGSRLGELTSFWSKELVGREGLIHVDVDTDVFGSAYPSVPTFGIQAEIGAFVDAVLAAWPAPEPRSRGRLLSASTHHGAAPRDSGPVRPSFLMQAIQHQVVEDTNAVVITEAGNSFTLGSHYLRFAEPKRYRVSTSFGSMGQATAGVLGAALGSRDKAVAIVGDGAMLMLNEINTAAAYGIDAVWIVLNDARYGMIAQGMASLGWTPFETDFPRADFVAIARAMGGDGVRVEREADLERALSRALSARGPFVIDVVIDPDEKAPANRRNQSLVVQGVKGNEA